MYEYVAMYVDDLLVVMENPAEFIEILKSEYKYKIKGDGPLEYHLGTNYERGTNGELVYHAKKYITRMYGMYEKMFGEAPRKYTSPLEKGDHPELDESEILDEQGVSHYQSLIGSMQWCVTIARFDIATAVMTLSRFRAAPRQGHLNRAKRVVGYLWATRDASLVVRTTKPNLEGIDTPDYDWQYTVYGNAEEEIPKNLPDPKGKTVQIIVYKDANLYHDMVTGKAVTGILIFFNGTLVDWYSKRQATVEAATYGSEFVAARIAVDQIVDCRLSLRYLGVPIEVKTIMFGDNQSVVTSSTIPTSALNKRHNALAYHRVREAIAAGFLKFVKIDGAKNPADIVSKHWGWQQIQTIIKPLLFWRGNMEDCLTKEDFNNAQT